MAEAMLEVINDRDLRESLIARGLEYVELHGWGRKKKQYLDLIDSLSTELFLNVQPSLGHAPSIQRGSQQQPRADHVAKKNDGAEIELTDAASVSSVKSR